ncbi:MAG: response regulator [Rickettsiales bacterium]|nr:response regulator [Rickettsiales bacterium]
MNEKHCILLVESLERDALRYCDYFKQRSADYPIEVVRCADLHDAFSQLKALKDTVETIIMDVHGGQRDEVEQIRDLRRNEADIPVIALSDVSNHEVLSQSIIAGANDYLVKGRDDDKLLRHTQFQIDYYLARKTEAA